MCSTCGCETEDTVKMTLLEDQEAKIAKKKSISGEASHDHHHHHHHNGHENHGHATQSKVALERDVLHKNNLIAERIRGYLEAKHIVAINLVSAPGSGKTTLLEKTILEMKGEVEIGVIEGDQQTTNDAERIHATGAKVVQVNTGSGCHLDAEMVNQAMKKLDMNAGSLLLIENVGNLVCPALFDLGENKRVVIMSVTEGEDKPLKYPNMFATSDLCIINKTDLLPYVTFDMKRSMEYALRVNHHLEFIETSASQSQGIVDWIQWIRKQLMVIA